MNRHLTGTAAQCAAWRAEIDADAGCPIRGVTNGGPDRVHPTEPGPGWAITVVHEVLQTSPGLAVLEVPDDRTRHFGRGNIPDHANARDTGELPAALVALIRARRGLDEDGNPLPASAGARAGREDL